MNKQAKTSGITKSDQRRTAMGLLRIRREMLQQRLRDLGADAYDLILPETHIMPLILQPGEQIEGIVYGRYKQSVVGGDQIIGRGALVATNMRVLLVDRKPIFTKSNEIAYKVVSAVSYTKVWPASTVTLHTRLGNIAVRTFNQKAAYSFVTAIEGRIFPTDTLD